MAKKNDRAKFSRLMKDILAAFAETEYLEEFYDALLFYVDSSGFQYGAFIEPHKVRVCDRNVLCDYGMWAKEGLSFCVFPNHPSFPINQKLNQLARHMRTRQQKGVRSAFVLVETTGVMYRLLSGMTPPDNTTVEQMLGQFRIV